ncbi:hypothetical protein EON63_13125 [archaeon]|nr:MAG: hypothetical protein EON63_13125 [archaeon]
MRISMHILHALTHTYTPHLILHGPYTIHIHHVIPGCLAANLTLPHVTLPVALQRAVMCATYSVQRKGSQVSYVGYEEGVRLGCIDPM